HLILVAQAGIPLEANARVLLTSGKSIASLVDQWVLIHQGFAMQQLSTEEAHSILDALNAVSGNKNRSPAETRRQRMNSPYDTER
ncbi:MAG: HypC/HybG/HupF family hydrogenase formation chaperone, partial [Proteobacteria bacterium]|nr:HypC/HybG/HupF family hydrogenase formation chaperone [Pseudomonadota bacterium]